MQPIVFGPVLCFFQCSHIDLPCQQEKQSYSMVQTFEEQDHKQLGRTLEPNMKTILLCKSVTE